MLLQNNHTIIIPKKIENGFIILSNTWLSVQISNSKHIFLLPLITLKEESKIELIGIKH